jgi:hypothetical protein
MVLQRPVETAVSFNAFNFVPLVTEELSLICGIEILFLRPDYPGAVVSSGDIDNRLKTLFDALRMPQIGQLKADAVPSENEKPFYVLLEDDKLISRLSVETDTLLEPIGDEMNKSDARLIITVKLRPPHLSWDRRSASFWRTVRCRRSGSRLPQSR